MIVSIGVASYGALGHVPGAPLTSNNLIFSVHLELHKKAQGLTATLYGCLTKRICSLYYFVSFYMRQVIFILFCAPSRQILTTPVVVSDGDGSSRSTLRKFPQHSVIDELSDASNQVVPDTSCVSGHSYSDHPAAQNQLSTFGANTVTPNHRDSDSGRTIDATSASPYWRRTC